MQEKLKSPVVLFRSFDSATEDEFKICEKYFVTTKSRMSITGGDLVIGRYSVLPFYKELERDIKWNGGSLINSHYQYCYVADLKNWYYDLGELTPETWFDLSEIPDNAGDMVLKGETNSRKDRWKTHMFAKNKKEATEVYLRLRDDQLFDNQNIYARKFVKFKKYFDDVVSSQPIIKEFRVFCYKTNILAKGFYWSNHLDQINEIPDPSCIPDSFLTKVMNILSEKITFYSIDVAETESGDWMVVEVNDGQQSGLSNCSSVDLYKNLKWHLWEKFNKINKIK
jgi:hypothetical protein